MWIWYTSRSSGGSPSAIAARAKASNIGTVFIKSSDGTSYWSQFNSAYVKALQRKGLDVCAWQYVYGNAPAAEAREARRAIQAGADCLVIDAETEYEGKYAQASTYMSKLRSYAGPDYPIGLAGWPYVDYHPGYPFSVFLGPGGAQFDVPQMYWRAIGVSVDVIYSHTYLYNSLYARPIAPLGQTYNNPSATNLTRFRELAGAYGAPGVSWWSWQSTSSGSWRSLARTVTPLVAAQSTLPNAPTLKRGAKGDMVVWAQEHLLAAGRQLRVNGIFDSATVRAVKAFQKASAITRTGILDVVTWWTLLAHQPAAVKWVAPSKARAAKARASNVLPPPASAKLPARAREIPPKQH
jgi:peptidoglycan hydrolase-like protein with peptidoglycan-binding domain